MNSVIILAKHTVITPRCRIVHGGDSQAFDKAIEEFRDKYEELVSAEANKEASFHLILNIERIRSQPTENPRSK